MAYPDEWNDVLKERDQLKSENERLQKYKEKLISDATQNDFVLLAYHDSLKEMKARVQELEEALTKIASYESMRFRLSPYEYGVLEQIVGIAEHALRDGE